MDTIKDVLLYLARHVPASHGVLAAMEDRIEQHFGEDTEQAADSEAVRLPEGPYLPPPGQQDPAGS